MSFSYKSRFTLLDSDTYSDNNVYSKTFLNDIFIYTNQLSSKFFDKIPYPFTLHIENLLTTSLQNIFDTREKLSISPSFEAPLPIAVRYIASDNTFFIERPPFQVDVDILLSKTNSRTKNRTFGDFKIWIPWTITLFNPSNLPNVSLFFSHKSLSSMEDTYFPSFLPNTFSSGGLCLGGYSTDFAENNKLYDNNDLRYVYSSILNEYLNGGWNLDVSPNLDPYATSYYNQINHGNILPEDYPTLNKFFYPTEEQLSKVTFKLRKDFYNKCLTNRYLSYPNSYPYKYFFTLFSTFTLEETLSFYKELTDFSLKLKSMDSYRYSYYYHPKPFSFEHITDNYTSKISLSLDSKNYPSSFYKTYRDLSFSISSSLYRNVDKFFPEIYPSFSSNIILSNSDNFSQETCLQNYYNPHFIVPTESVHSLVTKLLYVNKNNLYDLSKAIVFYNINTEEMNFHTPSSYQSFSDYYLEYLNSNYKITSSEIMV